MNEKEKQMARKASDGLRHCLPKGTDPGGCSGCPYYAEGCACVDRETVTLPSAMIEDFRQALAAYADGGNG